MKSDMLRTHSRCDLRNLWHQAVIPGIVLAQALALGTAQTAIAAPPQMAVPSAADHNPIVISDHEASDGPGKASPWANSAKQGVGAAYTPYQDHAYPASASKVWFSLASGVLTETMYGRIDAAQIRQMQFAVAGQGWTAFEDGDTTSQVRYLRTDRAGRPLSPAYRLTNRDKKGRFVIIKDVFTDPDHQTLMMRVTLQPLGREPLKLFVVLDPSVNNTSGDDEGAASPKALTAFEGQTALSLRASQDFVSESVGFSGVSDGLEAIKTHQALAQTQASTQGTKGNIVLIGQFAPIRKATTYDLAIGFGSTAQTATGEAEATLKSGYRTVLTHYNGDKGKIGWKTYLDSLSELKSLIPFATDKGRLLYASALTLKVQEDRGHAGAMIASLSNPWGDTVYTNRFSTGYKAVWPRDFYQVSMAMAALGDRATPVAAFNYLPTVQVTDKTLGNTGATGWFQQKSHIDGKAEWVGVQLDQTAMPILLGWKLEHAGLISWDDLKAAYSHSLKPAADFLSYGGQVGLDWNHATITPPYSQQERWEEQEGYSPSTTAAVIAGLEAASDIARRAGDTASASTYEATAKAYSDRLESRLYTPNGMISGKPQAYYLRISRSEDASKPGQPDERNGKPALPYDMMVDAGFLELVRYGVRSADDSRIKSSLAVIDDQALNDDLRVRYDFKFQSMKAVVPGFRRYGHDGYGDTTGGHNYGEGGQMAPDQRGRVWPIFTGERGHYELAVASRKRGGATKVDINHIRQVYVKGLEHFANEGLMIPEQVWDGVGQAGPHGYTKGQGTDSATPLAWAHAEYIKLLRSLRDRKVWDQNDVTYDRLAKKP